MYTYVEVRVTILLVTPCQKNQGNLGPGPRDLPRQRRISRSARAAALPNEGQQV